jgi:hypothetical protein
MTEMDRQLHRQRILADDTTKVPIVETMAVRITALASKVLDI